MKGSERNVPCPCGSGKKRKKCEPTHADCTPAMTLEMEQRLAREQAEMILIARARGRRALQQLMLISAVVGPP